METMSDFKESRARSELRLTRHTCTNKSMNILHAAISQTKMLQLNSTGA